MREADFEDPVLLALMDELAALEARAVYASPDERHAPCPRRTVLRLLAMIETVEALPQYHPHKRAVLPRPRADVLLAWADLAPATRRARTLLARHIRSAAWRAYTAATEAANPAARGA